MSPQLWRMPVQGCEVACIGFADAYVSQYSTWRRVKAVHAFGEGLCAIHSDSGRVSCVDFDAPASVAGVISGLNVSNIVDISIPSFSASSGACLLDAAGKLTCVMHPNRTSWNGDLHVRPPQSLAPVTTVSMGVRHTCVITTSSDVVCFGRGRGHWNPDNTTEYIYDPFVAPPGLTSVVQLASGKYLTCGLLKNGSVQCW